VTWLEHPRDDAERLVRSALDQAAGQAGDEMARRRVWSAIETLPLTESPLRPRRPWLLPALTGALVACGAAAAVWLIPVTRPEPPSAAPPVATGVVPTPAPFVSAPKPADPAPADTTAEPPVRRTTTAKARVALGRGTGVELDANSVLGWDRDRRPLVERGRALFQVAPQPPGTRFSVGAGPYLISVIGTRFSVRVTDERVSVDVEEGVVEVWRSMRSVRLSAGDSWAGPLSVVAAAGRKPSASVRQAVAADSELREAQEALAAGRLREAVDVLGKLARGSGPTAENAAYEMGRILRDRLHRPREAVSAWNRYRSRFPRGLLRAEADLSVIETLASMDERVAALAEAEAFLARHPASERRAEVERLAGRLRGAVGQ
jgi:ferric-dicitrate binding protein FerR (iron transport regulator)